MELAESGSESGSSRACSSTRGGRGRKRGKGHKATPREASRAKVVAVGGAQDTPEPFEEEDAPSSLEMPTHPAAPVADDESQSIVAKLAAMKATAKAAAKAAAIAVANAAGNATGNVAESAAENAAGNAAAYGVTAVKPAANVPAAAADNAATFVAPAPVLP
ncbi:circumsporozoite protein-like [Drosophila takahashii]|uniref:circumsporozoite protein-like n=1 Tax=Drosophila takahashii TaxID=29030 RepID=UPI003899079B